MIKDHKATWPVLRYDLLWYPSKLAYQEKVQKEAIKARAIAEDLNRIAKKSPFSKIYSTRKHDPL